MADENRPLLEVVDLHTEFHVEKRIAKAVGGVSFDVRPGEVLGIVGESGSGKSVTSLSILRLIPDPPGRIASGEIRISQLMGGGNVWLPRDVRLQGLDRPRSLAIRKPEQPPPTIQMNVSSMLGELDFID